MFLLDRPESERLPAERAGVEGDAAHDDGHVPPHRHHNLTVALPLSLSILPPFPSLPLNILPHLSQIRTEAIQSCYPWSEKAGVCRLSLQP